jgi:Putative Actinobacterial Holin-X, holin superfamily III
MREGNRTGMGERGSASTAQDSVGLGGATRQVAEHASAIARLELELALLELKTKATSLGIGIGLALGAVLLGLFGIGFLFAGVAAAFDTFLAAWLSLLITAALLLGVAGLLALVGVKLVQRAVPPVPEQAIEEAKLVKGTLNR